MSSEVNDVAPTSLSHLVGQRSVIEQVRVAIDAAFADKDDQGRRQLTAKGLEHLSIVRPKIV